jgi:HAE1 family hydrophobic/amphiphilic exporter-1
MEVPGGRVDEGARELTVRTMGRIVEPAEFNNLVVANRGDYSVKLSDVGYAEDTAEEPRTEARLNGQPAVTLIVSKQSGQNTVAIADAVKARLAEVSRTLPPGFKTEVVGDQSIFIKASIEAIQTHLIEGSILAAIVVFVFLWSFRSTLIAGLAIPTSIIATFGLRAAMGFTLNNITMLALTLMVGIVIDDAIVVLENIFRFIEEKGVPPFQAAIDGTKEIGLAVMATTLSLLAVFLPVGFMGGIVGRFMSSFGLTSAFAIAVSLLVSFTLTPMLAARLIKRSDDSKERSLERATEPADHGSKESRFYRPIDRTYTKLLTWSMRHRWAVVLACVIVIGSIVPLFIFVGKNFLPVDDQSQFEISVRAPEGSTLVATSTLTERIATDLRKLPGVTDTLTTIGGGQQEQVNVASIYVKLTPIEERNMRQEQLMVRARNEVLPKFVQQYQGQLRTSVQQVAAISGGGFRNADIQYVIGGPDLNKLTEYSDKLLAKMKTIPDVVDADSTLISGKPELRVVIDRDRAADLGVRVGDIAQALNSLVAGQKVSTFNAGTDQYDVRVRAVGAFRTSAEGLTRMIVSSTKVGWVSLDNLVHVDEGTGPSAIDRLNRQRQVMLLANVRPGGSQAAVIQQMNQFAKEIQIDPSYSTGLAGRSKELGRAGYYFALAFLLSFVFMYMVLAAQFESFIHPVTILLTLPLAIPFGILSLLMTGQTVNIFSGLGLLLLFGVVKKNAILQIDHTNQLRERGMERLEAIIRANRDRLRPILMTTIALVAGMMPLTIARGPGSGTNRSIGVLVVGGQTLCLLLTLLAVPVFYSLFDDLARSRVWGRMRAGANSVFGRVRRRAASAAASLFGLFLVLMVVGVSANVSAQQPAPSPSPATIQQLQVPPVAPGFRAEQKPLPDLNRVGVDMNRQRPLALRDAIASALENNKDIEVARENVRIAEFDLRGAQGVYDPRLTTSAFYERAENPISSFLSGGQNGSVLQSDFAGSARLEGQSPVLGGSYRLDVSSGRFTTNNAFTALNPSFPTAMTVTYTQPLWRGLKFDQSRRQIEIARKNLSLTDAQFRQRAIDTITNVQRAYWDLVFALRSLQVQRDAVAVARTQLEHNRRLVNEGMLAPIDIVAAEAQISTYEQGVFSALEEVSRAENSLKNLIAVNKQAELWSESIVPVDPVELSVPAVALPDALKMAMENRPELQQSNVVREINEIDKKYFKEQTKPAVDLVGNYGINGLAGSISMAGVNPFTQSNLLLRQRVDELSAIAGLEPLPVVPPQTLSPDLIGGFGTSVQNLLSNRFNNFRVGVQISLPLRNRTAEANLGRTLVEGERIATQREQLEQSIQVEVRNSLQAVRSAESRLRAAIATRESNEQQFASEQRKLDAGQSTTFLVLERQTALVTARGLELKAQTDLNKAIADLQRATGNALSVNSIVVRVK